MYSTYIHFTWMQLVLYCTDVIHKKQTQLCILLLYDNKIPVLYILYHVPTYYNWPGNEGNSGFSLQGRDLTTIDNLVPPGAGVAERVP